MSILLSRPLLTAILLLILIGIIIVFVKNTRQTPSLLAIPVPDRSERTTQFGMSSPLKRGLNPHEFVASFGVEFKRRDFMLPDIETSPGVYDWTSVDNEFQKNTDAGIRTLPVLYVGNDGSLEHPNTSQPPADLAEEWNEHYGYSQSIYSAIYAFVSRYKNDLMYLVIENEADAPRFWTGSSDEYIRLLRTAAKAAHDASPSIKVTDSGITTSAWGYMIAYDNLTSGEWTADEALAWLKRFLHNSHQFTKIEQLTADDVQSFLKDEGKEAAVLETKYLFEQLIQYVDVVNFHSYADSEFLPDILAYIQHHAGGKPILTDEIGNKQTGLSFQTLDRNAQFHADELVKKLAIGMAYQLELMVWYNTNPKGEFGSIGYLSVSDENGKLTRTGTALKTFIENIGADYDNTVDLSDETVSRYQLTNASDPTQKLDIIWAKTSTEWTHPTSLATFSLTSSPIFIEYISNEVEVEEK